jgi:hypothetical protein
MKKRRVNVRLRTRTVVLELPVPRLECPICNTLWRIQNPHRSKEDGDERQKNPTLIRRGGITGSCGYCQTRFKAEVFTSPKRFRYIAQTLENIVKSKLANYWISTHKGPLPKILQLEEAAE